MYISISLRLTPPLILSVGPCLSLSSCSSLSLSIPLLSLPVYVLPSAILFFVTLPDWLSLCAFVLLALRSSLIVSPLRLSG